MGLDITAYRQLKKLDVVFDADGEPTVPETREPLDDYAKFYVNSNFPGREGSIEHKAVYSYADSHHFSAGGYGSYNAWREELAKLAGYPAVEFESVEGYVPSRKMLHAASAWRGLCEGRPFVELVNFSDCEGVIGSELSAKLAKDFADFDERAKAAGNDAFYDRYREWYKAFAMASDNGAVKFS